MDSCDDVKRYESDIGTLSDSDEERRGSHWKKVKSRPQAGRAADGPSSYCYEPRLDSDSQLSLGKPQSTDGSWNSDESDDSEFKVSSKMALKVRRALHSLKNSSKIPLKEKPRKAAESSDSWDSALNDLVFSDLPVIFKNINLGNFKPGWGTEKTKKLALDLSDRFREPIVKQMYNMPLGALNRSAETIVEPDEPCLLKGVHVYDVPLKYADITPDQIDWKVESDERLGRSKGVDDIDLDDIDISRIAYDEVVALSCSGDKEGSSRSLKAEQSLTGSLQGDLHSADSDIILLLEKRNKKTRTLERRRKVENNYLAYLKTVCMAHPYEFFLSNSHKAVNLKKEYLAHMKKALAIKYSPRMYLKLLQSPPSLVVTFSEPVKQDADTDSRSVYSSRTAHSTSFSGKSYRGSTVSFYSADYPRVSTTTMGATVCTCREIKMFTGKHINIKCRFCMRIARSKPMTNLENYFVPVNRAAILKVITSALSDSITPEFLDEVLNEIRVTDIPVMLEPTSRYPPKIRDFIAAEHVKLKEVVTEKIKKEITRMKYKKTIESMLGRHFKAEAVRSMMSLILSLDEVDVTQDWLREQVDSYLQEKGIPRMYKTSIVVSITEFVTKEVNKVLLKLKNDLQERNKKGNVDFEYVVRLKDRFSLVMQQLFRRRWSRSQLEDTFYFRLHRQSPSSEEKLRMSSRRVRSNFPVSKRKMVRGYCRPYMDIKINRILYGDNLFRRFADRKRDKNNKFTLQGLMMPIDDRYKASTYNLGAVHCHVSCTKHISKCFSSTPL